MPFRVAPKSGDGALEVGVDGVEDAAEWGGVSMKKATYVQKLSPQHTSSSVCPCPLCSHCIDAIAAPKTHTCRKQKESCAH